MNKKETNRVCPKGHQYIKSSDCPTCPVCEADRKPESGFLSRLAAPARRALENNGIQTIRQLAALTEEELRGFHGMGKASLPKLREVLAQNGLSFKK